jgi:hypothetical protein
LTVTGVTIGLDIEAFTVGRLFAGGRERKRVNVGRPTEHLAVREEVWRCLSA